MKNARIKIVIALMAVFSISITSLALYSFARNEYISFHNVETHYHHNKRPSGNGWGGMAGQRPGDHDHHHHHHEESHDETSPKDIYYPSNDHLDHNH